MKKILSVLVLLALTCPAAAHAEFELVRGAGQDAMFLSTARPALAVKAAPELMPVSEGKMTVLIPDGRSIMKNNVVTVWYGLRAHNQAQLVFSLAEGTCSRDWYPGILGTNLEFLPVLYSCGSDRASSVTQRVFIRPVQLDPWMEAFDQHGYGWTASLLVSQYEWIVNNGKNKVLVEYREPCASEGCPVIIPEEIRDFVHRANTSFSARFVEHGDISSSQITPWGWNHTGVSSRLLSSVLGGMGNLGD